MTMIVNNGNLALSTVVGGDVKKHTWEERKDLNHSHPSSLEFLLFSNGLILERKSNSRKILSKMFDQ